MDCELSQDDEEAPPPDIAAELVAIRRELLQAVDLISRLLAAMGSADADK